MPNSRNLSSFILKEILKSFGLELLSEPQP